MAEPPNGDAAVAQTVSLPLDSDEIAMLLKRGKDALSTGDFASARLLLRRGAEAGSAEAALALGATFDPLVLRRLGAIGAAPDAAQARQWYQKAVALGSTTASQPLAKLEASAQ
jgi:TPR repeat protein